MSAQAGPSRIIPSIQRRPALPAAAALILGIFLHDILPVAPWIWAAILAVGILTATTLLGRAPIACSAILLASTAAAGLTLAQVEAFYYPRNHISAFATDLPRLAQLELKLTSPPRVLTWQFAQYRATPPRQAVTATVTRVKTTSGWVECSGQLLVQITQPNPRLLQGERVRAIGMLQRPAPAANPGQFDWASYYREQRVLASLTVNEANNVHIIDGGGTSAISWLRAQTRHALSLGFESFQSLDHALLGALLLGDYDPELRDVQEQFRRTGTSHHLAISGMHVAVLGGVVFLICRLLRIGPRAACWAMLVFIILYGVIALPSPPVVRSVLLCACLGFGVLQRRSTDPLQLLALSILAMLVFHPLDLFNAGFQLSFGTVLGLMLFAEPVLKLWPGPDFDEKLARAMQKPGRFSIMTHKLGQMTRATVTAGLVAWVVSMPLIALHFEQLNPWAILASIVLSPFVFVALIGGFAKVILTMLWPSLAGVWAGMAIRPVAGMRHVVDWLATFPGADIPLPAPPVWMVLLFYALLLLNLVPWKSRVTRWAVGLAAVAGCLTLAILPLRGGLAVVRARSGEMKVTLLSIGAGQCAVVEPPGADAVVIDAGSMAQTDLLHKTLGPFLRHEGRRDIREVFISHANYDHFSAVAEISQAYDVHDIFVAPQFRRQSSGNAPAEVLLQTLDQLDRPPKEVSIGRSFNLGGGATMEVLWPPADSTFDANNTSLVMRLTFAGRSVLFTGDIQGAAERELLAQPDKIKSDVLIGPHHGSRESTTLTFINAVAPAEILCSNDRSLSVKQKEFDREMQGRVVYRTHTSGAVTIHISKEGQVSIEPYLQEGRKR